MPRTPQDVNDREGRQAFLREGAFEALAALRDDTAAGWGHMTAQQMVEHLVWVFECSTGRASVHCPVPEEQRPRYKQFLQSNMPTPREFVNTALVDGLPPLRFAGVAAAVAALRREVDHFFARAAAEPEATDVHPVFGPITPEEWSRAALQAPAPPPAAVRADRGIGSPRAKGRDRRRTCTSTSTNTSRSRP